MRRQWTVTHPELHSLRLLSDERAAQTTAPKEREKKGRTRTRCREKNKKQQTQQQQQQQKKKRKRKKKKQKNHNTERKLKPPNALKLKDAHSVTGGRIGATREHSRRREGAAVRGRRRQDALSEQQSSPVKFSPRGTEQTEPGQQEERAGLGWTGGGQSLTGLGGGSRHEGATGCLTVTAAWQANCGRSWARA
ncbi:hypothetical protein AXG93_4280s1110 [Marchantia polymorpha subsp. ruderalis]|uniref:Uncharacterized protein n=1 Tax=Marchantia polymorpha subsp. ruderalis TaxID=1480154 RepID=A0A176WP48_MARPO|nr:hypothetical protein AXG93_4280s1110 [Marchantia polymorpha subsp. ruderalis]